MTDRERRVTEENAVFEKPKEPALNPSNRQETATEEVDRKEAALPHGGLSPDYDENEAVIDVDKEGVAHKRDPEDMRPSQPANMAPRTEERR